MPSPLYASFQLTTGEHVVMNGASKVVNVWTYLPEPGFAPTSNFVGGWPVSELDIEWASNQPRPRLSWDFWYALIEMIALRYGYDYAWRVQNFAIALDKSDAVAWRLVFPGISQTKDEVEYYV